MQKLPESAYTKFMTYFMDKLYFFPNSGYLLFGFIIGGGVYHFIQKYDPLFLQYVLAAYFYLAVCLFIQSIMTVPAKKSDIFNYYLAWLGLVLIFTIGTVALLDDLFSIMNVWQPIVSFNKANPLFLKYTIRSLTIACVVIYLACDYKKFIKKS